jgi:hypothetical protein
MKKYILLLTFFTIGIVNAQIGIGTVTPNSSSILDVTSTTKGLLPPKMTQAQRTSIATPATGLLVFQTDGSAGYYFYNGASWQQFSAGNSWSLNGNSGTVPATNKLGTTDNQPLLVKTNNAESFRILGNGNVVMGNTTSTSKLHLQSATSSFFTDGFEDNTVPPFTTSGAGGNWTTTNTAGNFNSGTRGVQSGTGVHSSQSDLIYTTTLTGNGSISFAFKTSCESVSFDNLRFYIDGVEQNRWGGTTAWTTISFAVTSGLHTFTWSYFKDSSVSSGDDKVYIDDVAINIVTPILRIVDGNQANNYVMVSDANGNGTWTNPSGFSISDDDWRFNSGSAYTDPIYRTGDIRIGSSGTPSYELDVDQGIDGNQTGLGSSEYITDGSAENWISNTIVPQNDNSVSLGSASLRWSTIYATNGVINTSDSREKENIQPLHYGLQELKQLKPVSYQWKEEKYGKTILSDSEKRNKIGFIAQDLQNILPETVQDSEWRPKDPNNLSVYEKRKTNILGVSYSEILPVVIKATQENQNTLNEVKKLLDEATLMVKQLEKK